MKDQLENEPKKNRVKSVIDRRVYELFRLDKC